MCIPPLCTHRCKGRKWPMAPPCKEWHIHVLGTRINRPNHSIAYNPYAHVPPRQALDILEVREKRSLHIGGDDLTNTCAAQGCESGGVHIPLLARPNQQLQKDLRDPPSFCLQPLPRNDANGCSKYDPAIGQLVRNARHRDGCPLHWTWHCSEGVAGYSRPRPVPDREECHGHPKWPGNALSSRQNCGGGRYL